LVYDFLFQMNVVSFLVILCGAVFPQVLDLDVFPALLSSCSLSTDVCGRSQRDTDPQSRTTGHMKERECWK